MKNILRDNKGLSAIEMSIVLPLLLMLILAVVEFGLYFFKAQTASRVVSTASISLQQEPNDGAIKPTMQKNGLRIMDFTPSETNPNFVCAKSYATVDEANNQSCVANQWSVTRPEEVDAGEAYYIAVRAFAEHTEIAPIISITGLLLPDIDSRNVISINTEYSKGIVVLETPIGSNGNWTVPDEVTQIKVTVIGGAGGGSGGGHAAHAGGGGGGTVIAYIGNLTPGTIISYQIGRGGPGDSNSGGDTTFNGITALGGGAAHGVTGGTAGGFSPVTSVSHGVLRGYVGLEGQVGFVSGTGGYSGGGFGSGAHTTTGIWGYSGLPYGGGAGSSSGGNGGVGGQGAVIIEW